MLVALALTLVLTLASCSAAISDEAFASQIARVDQLLLSGSKSSALRRLTVLSKKAISVPQRLGVYRRLVNGGSADAEACLVLGLKTSNASPELNAVYASWLQAEGRRDEALSRAEFLTGTRFESLRTELLLSDGNGDLSPGGYTAAYTATGNPDFLQNAGVGYALKGDFAKAAKLPAAEMGTSLFWATVLIDAGLYDRAYDFLHEKRGELPPARLERLLLLQDALDCSGDAEGAREVREEILSAFDAALVPPVVFYNRALDAEGEGDAYTRGYQLDSLLQNYPDYVPGLAALGDYALSRIPPRPDATGLESDLEAGGLRSRGMAEQARILRFEAPAVLERMEASLKRHPSSPDLLVEYFKLARRLEIARGGQGTGKQDAFFWATLERLNPARGECPPLLANYAVSSLLTQGHYRDARRVFEQYLQGEAPKAPWERECAAYFAAQNGDARTALNLYASLIEGEQALMADGAAKRTYKAPLGVHVNFTLVLAGAGQYRQAVAYCRRTMESVSDPALKANLAFSLAELQIEMHEGAEAIRTLEYCLLLKPEHQQARALLRRLRG